MKPRTWKDDYANVVFAWLIKSTAPKPEAEDETYWTLYQKGYARAIEIAASPFTWAGHVGIPLALCMPDEETPLIQGSSPGITMSPKEILFYVEDLLNSERYENPDVDGIMMSCKYSIASVRMDWFCEHWFVDDEPMAFTPNEPNAVTVYIPTEICVKCGMTREKQDENESDAGGNG